VAKTKSIQLSDLKLSKNPLILIAEAPKTREYWRITATADAANLDAVLGKSKFCTLKHGAFPGVGCLFTASATG
jgi:TrmH family RNA methyltransferase